MRIGQSTFSTFDDVELFYRFWFPKKIKKTTILLLHRGHEHSGRLKGIAKKLVESGYRCFSYDARGHGNSPGKRGYCDDVSQLVKDLDTFVKHIEIRHEVKSRRLIIIANSLSGVIATSWVHDYAPFIQGMILVAPAFRIKLYVPFAVEILRILTKLVGPIFIKSYVKSRFLTHDKKEQDRYDSDNLITKDVASNVLVSLVDTARRMLKDAKVIETPMLILSAGTDWVVENKDQRLFFEGISSKNKKFITYEDFYHGLLYEKDRQKVLGDIKKFIRSTTKSKTDLSHLIKSDINGPTKVEFDKLKQKPSVPKRIIYSVIKIGLNTFGRLSKGVNIGVKFGFDSGLSLDHVYQNNAQGFTLLGKAIDRAYLNSIGWKGIRVRKTHLQQTIRSAIDDCKKRNKPVKILDIAAGPGRYLLEIAKEEAAKKENISLLLCDINQVNLNKGKKIASGIRNKNISFKLLDAFDERSYLSLNFKPNIVIVSGLYELNGDNQKVLQSLRGIRSIAAPGCQIIYTGQPWHPQLEFIARSLSNHLGEPWVMRRRSQKELDYLFDYAGYKKENMEIDTWGIFTVSHARLKKNK